MKDNPVLRVARKAHVELARRSVRRALKAVGLGAASAIRTYTSPAELQKLYDLASTIPRNSTALEIGSYLGASSCYIVAGLAHVSGKLVCVDTWQNETMPDGIQDTFAAFQANTAPARDRIRVIRKESSAVTFQDVGTKPHFIFIDGDHGYEGVKADLDHFAPWLADGGILAMHDHACFKGVARAIGELLAKEMWVVMGAVDNLIWLRNATFEK